MKNYYIVLDTETVNGIREIDKNGKETLDLSQSLVYDIGWTVCDKKGHIVEKKSYIVEEIFMDYKELMKSGYYADKLETYWTEIWTRQRKCHRFAWIWADFRADCAKYDIKAIMAYNMRFDYRALQNTIRYLSKSKFRYFFPKDIEIWDIMKMFNTCIAKRKSYIDFCFENGYTTKHKKPRPQVKAEVVYKYITPNKADFVESHTGLEDAIIETAIFAYLNRQHKAMERKCFKD